MNFHWTKLKKKKVSNLKKIIEHTVGKPNVSVYTKREKCIQSLGRRWQQCFRTRRESIIFHCPTNQRLLYSQNGASYNHSLNKLTVKFSHFKRNHSTITESNQNTFLHPEFL
ncbi:hypothetical protein MtrunA17_Chr5g0404151 [Medicago truncatula]|uniref:Uncharacterized protein n=1 Tax=Medicago truncatula TaxID=3880 RepID=A0A396HNX3_MEDTR|nr:hypothetical protein MtrunA17_Chr5g0404151 [Medicago truncatula]